MQTKNTEKVSNGDLGFITGITTNSKGERLVQMDFGGDRKLTYTPEQLAHVDLAYATTIHKAMGSQSLKRSLSPSSRHTQSCCIVIYCIQP